MGNFFSVQLSCDTIITRCWDCAAGQAVFICKLEDNLVALRTAVTELKNLKNDVMTRVKIAEEQQQLKRLEQVEGWRLRAETVINEADQLIHESPEQINKLCMGGCCSKHPESSRKFGKQIAEQFQEVKEQQSKGVFGIVADRAPLPLATRRPCVPTVGLESTLNNVWSSVEDEQVGIIGLYGLGGVGKTTLLNQINNRFLDRANNFDNVIWVVVSQDLQIEKIQDEIGKCIGFLDEAWKHKRFDEKAADIFGVLRRKKFALLLDDIWEWINLTNVGIPLPPQENGSKVIFTTRSIEVCFQMRADKKIKVECLLQGEALKLFTEMVGAETLDRHPGIHEVAEAMVEECGGLPLALIIIGRAMSSKKTPGEWKYAIQSLRQSASVFPGLGKEMFPKLKFSYDCLPDKTMKSCFLYCCLFPKGYAIRKSELIHWWIGEGLLDEHANLSQVRHQGEYIFRSLIDACLLEDVTNAIVKMHDVIRDMALWLADESEKDKFYVKAGIQLKEQPAAERWENTRRVSLMGNQIESLSEVWEFPNLLTLFLGSNKLKVINNDFFNFMPILRALDLSFNANLEELPVGIAKLVSLEHLNMSYSGITKLPVELKALKKLKYLNLEHTPNLRMIPPGLISSLSMLQVLKMVGCGYEWLVEEIEGLTYLNVLTITFKSASMLKKVLGSNKFQSCEVEAVLLEYFRGSRLLNFMDLAKVRPLHYLGLKDWEDLEAVEIEHAGITSTRWFHTLGVVKLISCSKLRDATWVFFVPHLEKLIIHECHDLEQVINKDKLGEFDEPMMGKPSLFSELEVLDLQKLLKLRTIYRDALPFPQLKEVIIKECPELRKLPLNSDSAKGQKIVFQGEMDWWKDVEWEDVSTRKAFHPFFQPIYR